MDADTAWKVFQVLAPFLGVAGGAVAAVVVQRKRERITWEESAKGHLAKLRHEALAKCLAGVGELYEMVDRYERGETEEEEKKIEEERRKAAAEPLRAIAAHEFMLPPELRREVHKMLKVIHPYSRFGEMEPTGADAFCAAVDRYLPPVESREP